MSFKPVVTLTTVPRDNSSFTLTDATPTNGTDGYGSSNAPANAAAITSLFGMVQPYGELPTNASGVVGTVGTTMQFALALMDGLNAFTALYGLAKTFTDFTVSADGTQINTSDPALAAKLDGVGYIQLSNTLFPVAISGISGGTISLSGTLTPNAFGTVLYVYYAATVQGMTLNNGEALCVNGISLIPIEADHCDNAMAIFHNISLKLAAEIAFNCGNLSKAHEAARLLGGTISIPQNCLNCG